MISPTLAEFYGIMAGDGCISHSGKGKNSGIKYIIYICGHKKDDRNYFNYLKNLIKKLFNKKIKIQERRIEKAIFIRFSDKKIFQYIEYLGFPVGRKYEKIFIPDWVQNNKECAKAFLRGLFDTDGCFILSKQHKKIRYYPRIEISIKSKLFAKQVVGLLDKLKIKASLNKKLDNYRVEVPGKERCIKWMREINAKNIKHKSKYNQWFHSHIVSTKA